jgi:hypothetical protein
MKGREKNMDDGCKAPCVPDRRLAAVCGLFCPSCTAYIGAHHDPSRLETLAKRFGQPVEKLMCNGCRSEKRSYYCENICKMYKCAADKGVAFCGECSEYPCEELKTFRGEVPHRIELWKSQQRIKEAGFETWYQEMVEHFSCRACGTINSAYDAACWKCGAAPSCDYVSVHKEEIAEQMAKLAKRP